LKMLATGWASWLEFRLRERAPGRW